MTQKALRIFGIIFLVLGPTLFIMELNGGRRLVTPVLLTALGGLWLWRAKNMETTN